MFSTEAPLHLAIKLLDVYRGFFFPPFFPRRPIKPSEFRRQSDGVILIVRKRYLLRPRARAKPYVNNSPSRADYRQRRNADNARYLQATRAAAAAVIAIVIFYRKPATDRPFL